MFKHFISTKQFTSMDLLEEFINSVRYPRSSMVKGKVLATYFNERSTRTRLSFESAMLRLNGKVLTITEEISSTGKGESWQDTVRTIGQLADILVCRTRDDDGAAQAADVSPIPVINAGSGSGNHPTQGLLDIYTIWQHFGRLENLSVALVGDLKFSRTIHSLLDLLGLCKNITYHLLSPEALFLNPNEYFKTCNIPFRIHKSMEELTSTEIDILYITRNQTERYDKIALNNPNYYYNPKLHYLTGKLADKLPEGSIIMSPLPRGPELSVEVDSNPRAKYWQQVKNGLEVRMALLNWIGK